MRECFLLGMTQLFDYTKRKTSKYNLLIKRKMDQTGGNNKEYRRPPIGNSISFLDIFAR